SAAVRASVEVESNVPWLDEEVGAGLFQVTQEALSNIRKHAHASRVHTTLGVRGDRVRLTIRDDGVGFDPGAPRSEAHRGLRNMRARVENFGGEVRIESAPNEGTAIIIEVPASAGRPTEVASH
ncbi:MAG TPA: ATP-binding protein, partial [Dehalococcoidia bacterium]|nr:ATP-binding protein [Dehalococcoidia bacterium]